MTRNQGIKRKGFSLLFSRILIVGSGIMVLWVTPFIIGEARGTEKKIKPRIAMELPQQDIPKPQLFCGYCHILTYPGAVQSVTYWASYNGCSGKLAPTGQSKDLDRQIAGRETAVSTFGGCPAGLDVSLWAIKDGGHVPSLSSSFIGEVWGWMKDHPKRP